MPASPVRGRLRLTPSASECWRSTGPASAATTTCGPSRQNQRRSGMSMSSAEGSPAKTSVTPARRRASRASSPACGPSSPASFASFDPASSSWRTWPLSETGDSQEFAGTWPRAGTMRNGTVSPLPPLVPLSSVTGCSLWPTVRATDGERGGRGDLLAMLRGYNNPHGGTTRLKSPERRGGQLNPDWTDWYMGFPQRWTDCVSLAIA